MPSLLILGLVRHLTWWQTELHLGGSSADRLHLSVHKSFGPPLAHPDGQSNSFIKESCGQREGCRHSLKEKKKNSISDKVNWFLAWIYLVRWGQQAGPELMGTASLSALRWPTGETMGPLCGSHLIYRACWQSDSVYLHSRGQVQHKAPCVLGCTEEWQADRWP